jgi:hypothetical protein
MAAWSGVLAMSGFRYHGGEHAVTIKAAPEFRCFWSSATGWGTFYVTAAGTTLHVDHGTLECKTVTVNGKRSTVNRTLKEGDELRV